MREIDKKKSRRWGEKKKKKQGWPGKSVRKEKKPVSEPPGCQKKKKEGVLKNRPLK